MRVGTTIAGIVRSKGRPRLTMPEHKVFPKGKCPGSDVAAPPARRSRSVQNIGKGEREAILGICVAFGKVF